MTYIIRAKLTISVFTRVVADSASEAMEIARERSNCELSEPVGQDVNDVWCHGGELDGEPYDLEYATED
jgi:hypothetical protein